MFNDEGLGAAMAQHAVEQKAKDALERIAALERRLFDLEAEVERLRELVTPSVR